MNIDPNSDPLKELREYLKNKTIPANGFKLREITEDETLELIKSLKEEIRFALIFELIFRFLLFNNSDLNNWTKIASGLNNLFKSTISISPEISEKNGIIATKKLM